MENYPNLQTTKSKKPLILIVVLSVVTAVSIVVAVWAFVNYIDQKTDVDTRVSGAVAEAKKAQSDADEAKFAAAEKEPYRGFFGPDDFGRLTFKYPKTWSVYVDTEITSGGEFEAYLNPVSVPPVSGNGQQFALRVLIETKEYDKVIKSYSSLVKKGELSSSAVTLNSHSGTRLDGSFSKDIRGSMVILKIRDKTATIRTDANTFSADFDKLIKTIDFND